MLFINAVAEVYQLKGTSPNQRFAEVRPLVQKFITITPMSLLSMQSGAMNSPEMIRISSCYTMFGDFDKAFGTFLKEVQMNKLTKKYGMKMREKHVLVKPWPLRITEETTEDEFARRCATTHVGSERYVEFEKI
jgi:hypothetical protein